MVEGVALRVGEPAGERHLGQPLRVVDRDVQAALDVFPLAARFLIAGGAEQIAARATRLFDPLEGVAKFVLQLLFALGVAVRPLVVLPGGST